MFSSQLVLAGLAVLSSSFAQVTRDPGVKGPALELVHLYYDEWPTGIAVSASGRIFANYPGGLDSNDTATATNGRYTVAELTSNSTETPYPSLKYNSPPGGAINYTTNPASGANYADYFIGVQSVVIDSADRLWVLDTGRCLEPNGTLVDAVHGGPKLVGIDLTNNTVFQTILFPGTVAYPVSYLNDVRFDLRPSLTESGKGVAYITDSSSQGRTGLIVVDLGTGESWRHFDNSPFVQPERQFLAYVWGRPLYGYMAGLPRSFLTFGVDGIALSADGDTLYFGGVGNRYMYSVPTSRLRARGANSEVLAEASVTSVTQKGVSDGFETDTNNFIYHGNMELNAINYFDPATGTDQVFVRDPRISWADTLSVAADGYLYFNDNQLSFSPNVYPGTDERVRPFAAFRVKLPNNATKINPGQ